MEQNFKGICGLIGGPPCQDYSVGGKNAGIEGEKGRLIHSYLSLVKKVKPKFLFFENVEGLYKVKRHRAAFNAFVSEGENPIISIMVSYKFTNSYKEFKA